LLSEGKELGYITRTAFSPKLNALIAMGYVRREKSAPGSQLSFPTGTGTVIALPIV
jgi:glycine cleavage system aminomethyltransferase T